MLRKLLVVTVMLSMVSYLLAGTVSIGTASARGDLRVDSYLVKGNATLFDGSVIETGQATADLRLERGTEITMATSSRGTLYRDRLVLQQGQSQLAANNSFKLEANGLSVTPIEPNSRGVISLKAGNAVEVAALNGSFGVRNTQGILLASVRPGQALSFAMQAGADPTLFSGEGMMSSKDGHYFLTLSDTGVKYEITGLEFQKHVGKRVFIRGTVQVGAVPADGAAAVVDVSSERMAAYDQGIGTGKSLLILGAILGPAAGVGYAVNSTTQPSTSASR
jgi:hypothetical protein